MPLKIVKMSICSSTLSLPGWLDQHGYILNWYWQPQKFIHTWVLFRQPLHSYVCVLVLAIAIIPQRLQTWTWYGSDASNNLSLKNWAAPWAIWQSRSISPKRRPPSLLREKQQITLYFSMSTPPSLVAKVKKDISNGELICIP